MLASTAAAGRLMAAQAQAKVQPLMGDPTRGTMATSDPGPRDAATTQLNKFAFEPPPTDHGNLGTMKYSFSEARNRRINAGWAREITVRDFQISKEMAGVDTRLQKGAVRELHWHRPDEWAFMTYGTARITAVDPEGRKFVDDVKEGDLCFFPGGTPHSIQGLGDDGCEFILVFNDGNFSEDSTFLITDWLAHTPRDVLAQNLGVDQAALKDLPPKELYIFNAPVPGSLQSDLAQSKQPEVPNPFKSSLYGAKPIETKGGRVPSVEHRGTRG